MAMLVKTKWSLFFLIWLSTSQCLPGGDPISVSSAGPGYWDAGPLYTVPLQRQKVPVGTRGNLFKTAYFGKVSLGTPVGLQTFNVVFDTGSAHLVVPSTMCKSTPCASHRRYDRSKSPQAIDIDHDGSPVASDRDRDMITISFGTGEVTGVFVKELVCLGEMVEPFGTYVSEQNRTSPIVHDRKERAEALGPCVELQIVSAVTMSDDPFKTFHFDGILGLGLEGLSQSPPFNFLNHLEKSSTLSPVFSVFLAVEDDLIPSEITFGGWREDRLRSEVVWTPVGRPEMGYWQVPIRELRIGGVRLPLCIDEPCYGVVDTGTSLVAAPSSVVELMLKTLKPELRAALAPDGSSCSPYNPNALIEFVLHDGLTFDLTPADYARPVTRSRRPHDYSKDMHQSVACEPMLMSMDIPEPVGPNLFILGEPVFMKYLVVFDALKKRVGFGLAAHGEQLTETPPPPRTGKKLRFIRASGKQNNDEADDLDLDDDWLDTAADLDAELDELDIEDDDDTNSEDSWDQFKLPEPAPKAAAVPFS